jgi:hypothetical protein
MTLDLRTHTLDDRFVRIINELDRIPDLQEMGEVPYFTQVLQAIETQYQSLENYVARFSRRVEEVQVPFPSWQQKHTMAVIAERERVIIGDEPGTRKTAPAGLAKYALESKLAQENGGKAQKVKTVICCPSYLISNWIVKLEQYHNVEPNFAVITSQDKWDDLKRAAHPETDYIFVSYDLLYKSLEKDNGDDPTEMRAAVLEEVYADDHNGALEYLVSLGLGANEDGTDIDTLESLGVSQNSPLEEICLATALQESTESRTLVKQLLRILTKDDLDSDTRHPYYVVADEFHNVRDALLKKKTNAFYQLAVRARFFAALSGTPMPDNLTNLAVVASILDPIRFPEPKVFIRGFGSNPGEVRRFLAEHMKYPRLTTAGIVGRETPVEQPVVFEMSEYERAVYFAIQNSRELDVKEKLLLQRYAIRDARLTHPTNFKAGTRFRSKVAETFSGENEHLLIVSPDYVPSRWQALEGILEGIPEEDKFIIFTKFTRGVTKPVQDFVERLGYNTVRIDQSVSTSLRKIRLTAVEVSKLRVAGAYRDQKYRIDLRKSERSLLDLTGRPVMHKTERDIAVLTCQTNPDIDGTVASWGTLREGKDVTSTNHVISLDRGWIPEERTQGIARANRSGQTKAVYVYDLKTRGTIEDGVIKHTQRKKTGIDLALTPRARLSAEQIGTLTGRTNIQDEAEIRPHLFTSSQLVRLLLGNVSGGGIVAMEELIANGHAELLANNFNYSWDTGISANRARLMMMAMKHTGLEYPNIVELGLGPGQMFRVLRRPTVGVDYLEAMLEVVSSEAKRLGFEMETHHGSMHSMGFLDDGRFDMSTASNVLNILSAGLRSQAIAENKRVLAEGGLGMWVLPPSAIDTGDDTIVDGLMNDFHTAGFDLVEELCGRYIVSEAIDPTSGDTTTDGMQHLLIVGKNQREGVIQPGMFELKVDYSYSDGNGTGKPKKKPDVTKEATPKSQVSIEFQNVDTGLVLGRQGLKERLLAALSQGDLPPEELAKILGIEINGDSS